MTNPFNPADLAAALGLLPGDNTSGGGIADPLGGGGGASHTATQTLVDSQTGRRYTADANGVFVGWIDPAPSQGSTTVVNAGTAGHHYTVGDLGQGYGTYDDSVYPPILIGPAGKPPADTSVAGIMADPDHNALVVPVSTSTSPTGWIYEPTGQAVYSDGAPFNGSGYQNGTPTGASGGGKASTWTGFGPKGQGTYYLDGPNGTPGTYIGPTTNPSAASSATPAGIKLSTGGGFNPSSGSASSASADASIANTAANNANSIELEKMREAAATLSQQAQQAFQSGQTVQAQAFQSQADQLNRQVQLQIAAMGQQQGANKDYLDALESDNPARFLAFLASGGGNISNALAGNNTALGPESILAGARAKETLDQINAAAAGGGLAGPPAPVASGGGLAAATGVPGTVTPPPGVSVAAPPVTPPATVGDSQESVGNTGHNYVGPPKVISNRNPTSADLLAEFNASHPAPDPNVHQLGPTPYGFDSWAAYASSKGLPTDSLSLMQLEGQYTADYNKQQSFTPQAPGWASGMGLSIIPNQSGSAYGYMTGDYSNYAPTGAAAEVAAANKAAGIAMPRLWEGQNFSNPAPPVTPTPYAPGGADNLSYSVPQPIGQGAPYQTHTALAGGGLADPAHIDVVGDAPGGRGTGHEEGLIAPQGAYVIPHAQLMAMMARGATPVRHAYGGAVTDPTTLAGYTTTAGQANASWDTPQPPPVYTPPVYTPPAYTPPPQPAYATVAAPVAPQTAVAAPVTQPVRQTAGGLAPAPVTAAPVAATTTAAQPAIAQPPPVPQTSATTGTPTTSLSGGTTPQPIAAPAISGTGPTGIPVAPGTTNQATTTGGLAPAPVTTAPPVAAQAGLAPPPTLPTSGYGVDAPPTSGLGITPTDQSFMDAVSKIRGDTQVPNVSWQAANWGVLDPTLRSVWENALLSKYGIPIASTDAAVAAHALRGINRSPTFGVHVASSY